MKLGETIIHNGIEAVLVEEEKRGSCKGCYFLKVYCPVDMSESDYPLCLNNGIFKKVEENQHGQ